ncbi:MAG TPA: shikimate dehydrogenase [Pyrinomonadaceae bacterium]|nr:shikimate dehydrogenase [Pyrinomonadaceae bacterium]
MCVPVCEGRASELAQSAAAASEVADLIELRLDCLHGAQLELALRHLDEIERAAKHPLILTLRPAEQGGAREIDILNRLAFWVEHFLYGDQYRGLADIELDLLLLICQSEDERWQRLDWTRVICSHHDFTGIPAVLYEIYERMAATPARILKIAVRARQITDCIPVFNLLERARRQGREMIAIAMGPDGTATRILGPSRGAYLTYGSLADERATAPGQLMATSLRELYRFDRIDRETEIMGLMGAPVAHSLSPQMHNAAFAARSMNAVYIPFEVREAKDFLRRMAHPRTRELDWRLRGLSVTAPHKSTIMDFLDRVETTASEIGAVNTISIEDDGLIGYNTDAGAMLAPLRTRIDTLKGARCAVIGAGGAALSALWALQREGAETVLFARSLERARPLAERFGAGCARLENASFDGFQLVINATPLGTRGHSESETPATASQLRGARLVYDLVYNPAQTRFMREAVEAGCESIGGLEMLVAQAAAQFRLWRGEDAPLEVMREAAQCALRSQT